MANKKEQMIEGKLGGLMEVDDTVTWKARHLFKDRILKVKLTGMKAPDYFVDEQVSGDFLLMKHEHYFKPIENGTLMIDQFRFETGRGFLGKLANRFYLEKYMTGLLNVRNAMIKRVAESNQWKQYLNS